MAITTNAAVMGMNAVNAGRFITFIAPVAFMARPPA